MADYTLVNSILWQWDKGQKLVVPTAYTGSTYETHFYSAAFPEGITVKASAYTTESSVVYVTIPDILLTVNGTIKVYAYNSTTGVAHTESVTLLKVKARPMPPDYEYPTDDDEEDDDE